MMLCYDVLRYVNLRSMLMLHTLRYCVVLSDALLNCTVLSDSL